MMAQSIVVVLAALALTTTAGGHVDRALSDVSSYKSTHDAGALSMAIRELAAAPSATQQDRDGTLGAWIALFGAIDASMPAPNAPHPSMLAARPPTTPTGTEYPAGIAPDAINDAATRAAYERLRADIKAALDAQLRQGTLSTIDREALSVFRGYAATAFRTPEAANAERVQIQRSTLSATRKKALLGG